MSDDGDIVRDLANVPADHHDRCNSRDGRECDCYMLGWQPLIAALARLEATEAQRDALAEALRFYARQYGVGARLASDGGMIARAALAEAGLE